MPRKKKHWTQSKKGKEKLREIAAARQVNKKVVNETAATANAVQPQLPSPFDPFKDNEYERERFQRKPRELVIDINSLHLRFYFD